MTDEDLDRDAIDADDPVGYHGVSQRCNEGGESLSCTIYRSGVASSPKLQGASTRRAAATTSVS